LLKNVLGIKAVESEGLPDDLQRTKERKPDVLKKITDEFVALTSITVSLHFEFPRLDSLRHRHSGE
jgi:hypothetical protein